MITNFLLDHSALVPVALLLVALVAAGLAYLLPGRHRVLLALSLLPVLALTLVPAGGNRIDHVMCTAQFSLPTLGSVELLANVALFLPPALFATLVTGRPVIALVGASALSALVEALQALIPAIGRACDTNDWMMNTIGAVAGVLLAMAVRATPRLRRAGRPGGAASR